MRTDLQPYSDPLPGSTKGANARASTAGRARTPSEGDAVSYLDDQRDNGGKSSNEVDPDDGVNWREEAHRWRQAHDELRHRADEASLAARRRQAAEHAETRRQLLELQAKQAKAEAEAAQLRQRMRRAGLASRDGGPAATPAFRPGRGGADASGGGQADEE